MKDKSAAHAYSIVLQTLLSVQMNNKLIIGDKVRKEGVVGEERKESLLEQSRDTLHQSKKYRSGDKFMRCGEMNLLSIDLYSDEQSEIIT